MVLSVIANWQAKKPEANMEEAGLFVKTITVDGGMMLKTSSSSTGRAHRIENVLIT
jgi:large subunit ribosomal protein L22